MWGRRHVLAVVSVAVLVGVCSNRDSGSSASKDPNFVVVAVDDLDDTVSPYWDAMPETRGLIRDRGTTFSNSFAVDPVCCPARSALLTGMYPHNNGTYDSPTGACYASFAAGAENRSVGVRLQEAGYRTGFVGKYLNGYELAAPAPVPPGWDEWFGLTGDYLDGYSYAANHNGTTETFGTAEADYQTDVLAREAVSFVQSTAAGEANGSDSPFLLFLAPSAPHSPIKPAVRDAGHDFANAPLPRRDNFDEVDVSDKPTWLRKGAPRIGPTAMAREIALYRDGLGSLAAVDRMIADIADALRDTDQFDNTVFVFTSDNGYNRGAHRLVNKLAPYEESIRVPLAVAGPGVPHGKDDAYVTDVDLAPSLLELAGAPAHEDIDGRSIAPLLDGDSSPRKQFLVEYRGNYSAVVALRELADVQRVIATKSSLGLMPSYRALRTTEWLYVQWYEGEPHEYELYDLKADPFQLENLLATPAGRHEHAAVAAALQGDLERSFACAGAACRRVEQ